MALTKSLPVDVDTNVARLSAIKANIQEITTTLTQNKVKLDYLKKQFADLKNEAVELGVENLEELPNVIASKEAELDAMLNELTETIKKAEALLNG